MLSPRPTLWDAGVLVLLLVLTLLSAFPSRGVGTAAGVEVEVVTPTGRIVLPLGRDGRYPVEGPLGTAVLIVEKGRVRLSNPPCPNRICERMGPVAKAGEAILCVPNRVAVRVLGRSDVDAVTR